MHHRDGMKFASEKLHRTFNQVGDELWERAVIVLPVKDVFEGTLNRLKRGLIGVDGNGSLLAKIEHPNVIQSQDMVYMGMRKQDGIEAVDAFPQRLSAEVGCGIDHDDALVVTEKDGGAGAVVFGVSRPAYPAIASDHGDPG